MKVSIDVTQDKKNREKLMLTSVQVMAIRVTGCFDSETQIVHLWHEGLTTLVQCQLGFVGDPNSYQKTPFEKFCN